MAPATLRDLAENAGVSTATASRSLNDRQDVNEATRRRVQEVDQRLLPECGKYTNRLRRRAGKGIDATNLRVRDIQIFSDERYIIRKVVVEC